jgi:hypothetical protein
MAYLKRTLGLSRAFDQNTHIEHHINAISGIVVR